MQPRPPSGRADSEPLRDGREAVLRFNVFLLPNQIASGGVSGISTILKGVFGWQPGLVQYAFNIPLFIAGIIFWQSVWD